MLVKRFEEVGKDDVPSAGDKGANLGELARAGVNVPPGVVVTTEAYRLFLDRNDLRRRIEDLLANAKGQDVMAASATIRKLVEYSPLPDETAKAVRDAYSFLAKMLKPDEEHFHPPVAVRSAQHTKPWSPTQYTYGGQFDTYLNVVGHEAVLNHIRKCYASVWSAKNVEHRNQNKIGHFDVEIACVVMGMLEPEVSGVMFTANPDTGNRNEAIVKSSWGLGEAVVSGLVVPDSYTVEKATGKVANKTVSKKEMMVVASSDGVAIQQVPEYMRERATLSSVNLKKIVETGEKVATHYGAPQDIEWALFQNELFLLQSRSIRFKG